MMYGFALRLREKNPTGLPVGDSQKQLRYVPKNGFYRYKTNPNMFGVWIIAGNIKVNRILSDEEVVEINNSFGDNIQDLPKNKISTY